MAKKPKKIRVDALMVERGLAESLAKAQALVMAGQVVVLEQRVDKPSALVPNDADLRVRGLQRFVSRGGDKLAEALKDFGLEAELTGATVLDAGASTGGFTDCCLSLGAAKVYAVDVGTNQLAWKLRQDPRVVSLEQTDIRDFKAADAMAISFVVADISFNSLTAIIPALVQAAPGPGCHFLVLVKPQFELPRELVPDGGVVRDEADRDAAARAVCDAFAQAGLGQGEAKDSRVAGRAGNREIFFYVRRPS